MAIHPSGAVAPQAKPMHLWTDGDYEAAMNMALAGLSGVGDARRIHQEVGDVALHLRRPMTDREAASLPRKGSLWLPGKGIA